MASPEERLREFVIRYRNAQSEMAALNAEIKTLGRVLECFGISPDDTTGGDANSRRTNVKGAIIDLLEEVGSSGLNAAIAVGMARSRGLELDRGSVSSLLSRLKRDNAVIYDGQRYTLRQYAKGKRNDDKHDEELLGSVHAMA